jgi:hypothetical protein
VSWNPYPTLPTGGLRDLLGITRAMYRLALAEEPHDVARLQALAEIGRGLRSALKGAHSHPGTIAHQTAWATADHALKALRELVSDSPPLAALVAATARLFVRPGSMV